MEKAVIDRIDEGIAVLLVGQSEEELHVPLNRLPPGVQAGDWLEVTIVNGQVKQAERDIEETCQRRGRIRANLDKLFK